MSSQSFRDSVNAVLSDKGMSHQDLSELIGIPRQTLTRYLGYDSSANKKDPPLDMAVKISKALGVSLNSLAGIDDGTTADTIDSLSVFLGLPSSTLEVLNSIIKETPKDIDAQIYNPWGRTAGVLGQREYGEPLELQYGKYPIPTSLNNRSIIAALLSDSNYRTILELLDIIQEYITVRLLLKRLPDDEKHERDWLSAHPEHLREFSEKCSSEYKDGLAKRSRELSIAIPATFMRLIEVATRSFTDQSYPHITSKIRKSYENIHCMVEDFTQTYQELVKRYEEDGRMLNAKEDVLEDLDFRVWSKVMEKRYQVKRREEEDSMLNAEGNGLQELDDYEEIITHCDP